MDSNTILHLHHGFQNSHIVGYNNVQIDICENKINMNKNIIWLNYIVNIGNLVYTDNKYIYLMIECHKKDLKENHMNKRIFASLLAVCVVSSTIVPALATTNTPDVNTNSLPAVEVTAAAATAVEEEATAADQLVEIQGATYTLTEATASTNTDTKT